MDVLDRFLKNNLISNFMKIRPMGSELFHADGETGREIGRQTDKQTDGQTDRCNEANSRF